MGSMYTSHSPVILYPLIYDTSLRVGHGNHSIDKYTV